MSVPVYSFIVFVSFVFMKVRESKDTTDKTKGLNTRVGKTRFTVLIQINNIIIYK